MERLTYTSPMGYPVSKGACAGVSCNCGCDACGIYKIICRLSAYEDTDLTPAEITAMRDDLEQVNRMLYNIVQKFGLYHDGMDDAITDIMAMLQDGRLVRVPRPGDEIYEIDGAHGIVKHTVTDVHWVANTVAVDDAGQTWGDYYTDEEIGNAYPTRKAAEFAMDAAAAVED